MVGRHHALFAFPAWLLPCCPCLNVPCSIHSLTCAQVCSLFPPCRKKLPLPWKVHLSISVTMELWVLWIPSSSLWDSFTLLTLLHFSYLHNSYFPCRLVNLRVEPMSGTRRHAYRRCPQTVFPCRDLCIVVMVSGCSHHHPGPPP